MSKNFLTSEWFTGIVTIVCVLALFGIIVAVLFGAFNLLDKQRCLATLREMNIQGNYGYWEGCMVKTEKFGVIPLDQYIFVLTGK